MMLLHLIFPAYIMLILAVSFITMGGKRALRAFWRILILDRASMAPIDITISAILLLYFSTMFVGYIPHLVMASLLHISLVTIWISIFAQVVIFCINYKSKAARTDECE